MNTNLVNEITARQLKKDVPAFSSGDTVKVSVRIIENKKERIQVFQGVVMQRRGSGVSEWSIDSGAVHIKLIGVIWEFFTWYIKTVAINGDFGKGFSGGDGKRANIFRLAHLDKAKLVFMASASACASINCRDAANSKGFTTPSRVHRLIVIGKTFCNG